MSKVQVLGDYIKYKQTSVTSLNKLKDIEFKIKVFVNSKKKSLPEFTENDLIDYLNKLRSKYSENTINDVKVYIKNFIKWNFVDWSTRFRNLDKICKLSKQPSPYTAKDMLSTKEVEKIIVKEPQVFWKAYFSTLFYGGCRPSEVCRLKWKDLEFDKDGGAFFTIYSKKNKKEFLKYLPKNATFYLKQLQTNNSEYVFAKSNGIPIGRNGALARIKVASKKALGKEIDLYTIRHSIATILYGKEDKKDDDVAKQMGHSKSMKGTYTHNDKNALKKIAKALYIETENFPPEEKKELEKRVTQLELKLMLRDAEISKEEYNEELAKLT